MSLGPSAARKRENLLIDPPEARVPPDSGVRARCDARTDEDELLDLSDLVVDYEAVPEVMTDEPPPRSREPLPSTALPWPNDEATMRYLEEPEILLARCRNREARKQAASRSLPPPTPTVPPPRPGVPPPRPSVPPPFRPPASLRRDLADVEADLFPASGPLRAKANAPDRSRPLVLVGAVVLGLMVLAGSLWLRTSGLL